MKITNDEELATIFEEVGMKYDFKVEDAKFIPFSDFKVTWEGNRALRTIKFCVSDYAMNLEEDLVGVIAEIMFKRIERESIEGEYREKFNEYVLSKKFRDKNRPFYIERKKLDMIPFKEFEDCNVHWSKSSMYNEGYCSTLMKIITLNPELKNAPDYVIDTVIKEKYNTIQDGILNFGGQANHVDIDPEDRMKTKRWLVANDIKLGNELFN